MPCLFVLPENLYAWLTNTRHLCSLFFWFSALNHWSSGRGPCISIQIFNTFLARSNCIVQEWAFLSDNVQILWKLPVRLWRQWRAGVKTQQQLWCESVCSRTQRQQLAGNIGGNYKPQQPLCLGMKQADGHIWVQRQLCDLTCLSSAVLIYIHPRHS